MTRFFPNIEAMPPLDGTLIVSTESRGMGKL